MRVTIGRRSGREKPASLFSLLGAPAQSWFGRREIVHTITLAITFSEEELFCIRAANLSEYFVLQRPFHPRYGLSEDDFEGFGEHLLTVRRLVSHHHRQLTADVGYYYSAPEADIGERQLRDGLQGLKNLIDNYASAATTDTFEL
jgi:hypothetical protein